MGFVKTVPEKHPKRNNNEQLESSNHNFSRWYSFLKLGDFQVSMEMFEGFGRVFQDVFSCSLRLVPTQQLDQIAPKKCQAQKKRHNGPRLVLVGFSYVETIHSFMARNDKTLSM